MKTKQLIEKKYIIVIFITFFLLFNVPMALAKTKSLAAVYLLLLEFGPDQEVPKDPLLLTVYLPAILAASVEREEVDMHGYKYVYTMPYKGPIQIAPAGQQGNSHYYYFLYRMPKGQYGCATFGSKFLIEYPTGKDGKTFTKEITKCNKDWGIPGAWYRKGNCTLANDGHYHKEVFSMEVYYGASYSQVWCLRKSCSNDSPVELSFL